MNEKRILFVSHSGNLEYGAAKSLGLVFKYLDSPYDVILTNTIKKNYSKERIKEYCGRNCKRIMFFDLPLDFSVMKDYSRWNVDYPLRQNLFDYLAGYYRWIKFLLNRRELFLRIKDECYDCVYLNSSVLHGLIIRPQTIIHVRELISNRKLRRFRRNIIQAYAVISIDQAVFKSMVSSGICLNNHFVLTNPFDMTGVERVNTSYAREKYGLIPSSIVFLVAGVITADKGVKFIVDSFVNCSLENKVLIIAGRIDTPFSKKLEDEYNNKRNVLFVGEIQQMDELYAITDYLVRGEREFCIGRTVYEALYSGCRTIIPGSEDCLSSIHLEKDQFGRVLFYQPTNAESLQSLFKSCNEKRIVSCVNTNVKEYIVQFREILEKH